MLQFANYKHQQQEPKSGSVRQPALVWLDDALSVDDGIRDEILPHW